MKTIHTVDEEPLQVYETREEAESHLSEYANLCKSFGLVPRYRVKAAPMMRGHYQGAWGVWLVKHAYPNKTG